MRLIWQCSLNKSRGVATVRHFRHVPTHNFFTNFFLVMKNDKQGITYFNYVCFMFIVLMTSFHNLKDKHRASSNYSDFLKRHLHLRNRLLDQGYKKIRLIRTLKKFIFRYQDLVEIYSVSAEKIISDAFSYSENV
jgi:hypothetical protein